MDVQVTWASMRPGMRQPACFSTARPASVASSMGHTARIRPSRMTAQCLDVLKRGRGYPWMGVNCYAVYWRLYVDVLFHLTSCIHVQCLCLGADFRHFQTRQMESRLVKIKIKSLEAMVRGEGLLANSIPKEIPCQCPVPVLQLKPYRPCRNSASCEFWSHVCVKAFSTKLIR